MKTPKYKIESNRYLVNYLEELLQLVSNNPTNSIRSYSYHIKLYPPYVEGYRVEVNLLDNRGALFGFALTFFEGRNFDFTLYERPNYAFVPSEVYDITNSCFNELVYCLQNLFYRYLKSKASYVKDGCVNNLFSVQSGKGMALWVTHSNTRKVLANLTLPL